MSDNSESIADPAGCQPPPRLRPLRKLRLPRLLPLRRRPRPPPLREQQLDKHGRAYATGRRKDAVARVWLKPGRGKIVINGREQEVYFARPTLRLVINQPFDVAERQGQYDVDGNRHGRRPFGPGRRGQARHRPGADPVRARAPYRGQAAGFLTRDPRVVERKKYGRAKARRSFQFSKR